MERWWLPTVCEECCVLFYWYGGFFPWGLNGAGMILATHLDLLLWSRMNRVIRPLSRPSVTLWFGLWRHHHFSPYLRCKLFVT